jgi:hypothetical protein
MLRAASSAEPPPNPLEPVRQRAAEALALVESLNIQVGVGATARTKRKVNQVDHALEVARAALRRLAQLAASS